MNTTDSQQQPDPFDTLYSRWANNALDTRLDPPSRERWDAIILFLLSSQDPERVTRYRDIGLGIGENLGSDAFELWSSMPEYTTNKSAPVKKRADLKAYETSHLGAMRRLMAARGLGERYEAIVAEQVEYARARSKKAKRAQNSILVMGFVGIGAIVLMMLAVGLLIALQLVGK